MTVVDSWLDFEWPDWVPVRVREEIEAFWSADQCRSPAAWLASTQEPYNNAPTLGTEVFCCRMAYADPSLFWGRAVHCWNNIGRVVHEDGSYSFCSFQSHGVYVPRDSQPVFPEVVR